MASPARQHTQSASSAMETVGCGKEGWQEYRATSYMGAIVNLGESDIPVMPAVCSSLAVPACTFVKKRLVNVSMAEAD